MARASKDHVEDIGAGGMSTHVGSNGHGPKDRMNCYGKIARCFGENMTFDTANAEEVLISLVVDDGSKSRSHRNNLFKEEFGVMGCYSGTHTDFRVMTCIDYAGAFV